MKYVCLPLDDRPCTYVFPVQLAAACGVDVTVPQDMHDKDYRAPYPFEKAKAFLMAHAGNDVCLILAVDQLCYGGLITARKLSDAGENDALKRLYFMEELKNMYPGMHIHAFSVITRSSISLVRTEDMVYYNHFTLYSQAYHRAMLSGTEEDRLALEEIKSRIPDELLHSYHALRERNHRVNCACVRMAQKGVFDSLMLLQEDSQPYGVHKVEQKALRDLMGENSPGIWLHNGTDEGACLALMRAVFRERKQQMQAAVCYLRGDAGNFTALYEDRPFSENLRSQMNYAGIETACGEEAQDVLVILSPRDDRQLDIPDDPEKEADDEAVHLAMAIQMKKLQEAGKHLYLLDLTFANGGLPGILRAVDQTMGLENLWGYCAWNTTCNSLGTLLAQMLSDHMRGSRNAPFLWERILDDCMYEGVVRAKLREKLLALGEEQFCLRDWENGNRLLRALVQDAMQSSPLFAKVPFQVQCRLPWPRIFEAQFTCAEKGASS